MKLAICNEMFENQSFEEICRVVSEIGYQGIEIAPFTLAGSVTDIDSAERRNIRQTAARYSLEIVGLHWLLVNPEGLYITHPNENIRKRTAEYFIELVRFCADVGGKVLVIGSPKQRNLLPGVTRAKAFEYCKEVFSPALEVAADLCVDLCFEPLARSETDFITTASEGQELVEYINHPHFKLHLDVKAMSDEGRPIPDIIKEAGQYVRHFHVNDPNLLGPGMGDVEFRPIITALKEIGYDGYLSVEVFDYKPGPVNIAKQSYEYMQQVLADVLNNPSLR